MRTIKFRGKRLDGKWVYGDLVCHYENQRRFIALGQMAYTYTENGISRLVSERYHEVLPESVGQWTGLVDKNGVEIYEGDILRNITNPLVDNEPFIVCYDTQEGMWMWFDKNEEGDSFNWAIAKHSEIIGNIMDSPELMEVK